MRGIHLAQVIAVHPSAPDPTPEDQPPYAGTLDVILLDATPVDDPQRAYRVRVLRPRAHPSAGHYLMPEVGDFGLVAFYANDPRAGCGWGLWTTTCARWYPRSFGRGTPTRRCTTCPRTATPSTTGTAPRSTCGPMAPSSSSPPARTAPLATPATGPSSRSGRRGAKRGPSLPSACPTPPTRSPLWTWSSGTPRGRRCG
ncbi:phage baseplate assembly protein V [Thermus sp.]|uniref:phage baseplate assembly protein V n=1 Tax=Thermus sp. TaxID=275 RepID=UPI0039A4CA6A